MPVSPTLDHEFAGDIIYCMPSLQSTEHDVAARITGTQREMRRGRDVSNFELGLGVLFRRCRCHELHAEESTVRLLASARVAKATAITAMRGENSLISASDVSISDIAEYRNRIY